MHPSNPELKILILCFPITPTCEAEFSDTICSECNALTMLVLLFMTMILVTNNLGH